MRKTTRVLAPTPHAGHPAQASAPAHACAGCAVRAETIEFLRMQNRELMERMRAMEEKFLALAGDAADRYHRIRMTEMAQQQQGIINGVQDVSEHDEGDAMLDEFMAGFVGKRPNQ